MKEEAYSALRELGLSPYEMDAYLALLSAGSSTPVGLVSISGVPRSRIYEVLRTLAKKGFASIRTGKPTVFEAVPPEVALKGRIEALRKETYQRMEETKRKVEAALPIFARLSNLTLKKELEPLDIAWVYFNRDQFRNEITELIRDSRNSFRIFTSDVAGLRRDLDRDRVNVIFDALERNVEFKSIHGLSSDMDLDLYIEFEKKGAKTRVPKVELEETFWVIDGNVVAMAVYDQNRKFQYGLIIKNKFLSGLLCRFFDEHWEKSIPAGEMIRRLKK